MRKLLNYLLGEDIVNKQSNEDLLDAFIGLALCWIAMLLSWFTLYIFG